MAGADRALRGGATVGSRQCIPRIGLGPSPDGSVQIPPSFRPCSEEEAEAAQPEDSGNDADPDQSAFHLTSRSCPRRKRRGKRWLQRKSIAGPHSPRRSCLGGALEMVPCATGGSLNTGASAPSRMSAAWSGQVWIGSTWSTVSDRSAASWSGSVTATSLSERPGNVQRRRGFSAG